MGLSALFGAGLRSTVASERGCQSLSQPRAKRQSYIEPPYSLAWPTKPSSTYGYPSNRQIDTEIISAFSRLPVAQQFKMAGHAPNLDVYLKSLKTAPLESSIESLINLLKRRQIRNSRPCAIATAELLKRVVAKFRWTDVGKLLQRIQQVGQRLIEAQPREMVVGNIVRRVLGMIRYANCPRCRLERSN